MFTQQNKCLQQQQITDMLCLQNKTKVYKHVMFTKQNTKQRVYKTKLKFTNTLCLQNKIQKFTNTLCLQNRKFTKQNKTNVYKHVIFIKQKVETSYVYKTKQNKKFTDKLCLQNTVYKHVMFTNKNITNVYKTKVYKHVMFTKQKFTDKLCLQNKQKFTNTLCLQNKTESLQTRYGYNTKQIFTKQKFTNTLCL